MDGKALQRVLKFFPGIELKKKKKKKKKNPRTVRSFIAETGKDMHDWDWLWKEPNIIYQLPLKRPSLYLFDKTGRR